MNEVTLRVEKRVLAAALLFMVALMAVLAVWSYGLARDFFEEMEFENQFKEESTIFLEEAKICEANIVHYGTLSTYSLCFSGEERSYERILTPLKHPPFKPEPKVGPQTSADPRNRWDRLFLFI